MTGGTTAVPGGGAAPDPLGGKVNAPWSDDQVASLNGYQRSLAGHPFTCGRDHAGSKVLLATTAGWACPYPYPDGLTLCGYEQDWAHGFMADWSWKAAADAVGTALAGKAAPALTVPDEGGDGTAASIHDRVLALAGRWDAESRETRERHVAEGLHPLLAGGDRDANLIARLAGQLREAVELDGGDPEPVPEPASASAQALLSLAAEFDRQAGDADVDGLITGGTIRGEAFREAAAIARARSGAPQSGPYAPGRGSADTPGVSTALTGDSDATADGRWYDPATPEGRLFAAVDRMHRAEVAEPHAHADAEAEYAAEQVALAARGLVRHVEAGMASYGRPVGWDSDPVHGTLRPGDSLRMRDFTCGSCGEQFGSNCRVGDIICTNCEARLCSGCGRWEAEVGA